MVNPHSTATIASHPIHPMLIPFPIAFFVSVLVCDFVYWGSGSPGWAQATQWLLGFGIIIAAFAAAAGLADLIGDRRIRDLRDVWWHAGGNALVVVIQIINWLIRYGRAEAAILPWGLILSIIAAGILIFTGWKGWEMVYRWRVGVADEVEATRQ